MRKKWTNDKAVQRNQLAPNFNKKPWSYEESLLLFEAHKSLGNCWKQSKRQFKVQSQEEQSALTPNQQFELKQFKPREKTVSILVKGKDDSLEKTSRKQQDLSQNQEVLGESQELFQTINSLSLSDRQNNLFSQQHWKGGRNNDIFLITA